MTKKEYEELNRVALDKLGHQLHVGDLVIGYVYSSDVRLYKVKRFCKTKVVVSEAIHNKWETYMYPNKLIKIKKNGIPKD